MNIRQIKAIEKEAKERILKACPGCPQHPGIYVFFRTDAESGLRFAYVGQAKSLLDRCAQHLREYDHIALSLKKRGFKCEGVSDGWELCFWDYPVCALDLAEQEKIKKFADMGYQLFNRTAGSQSAGKVIFDNKKPPKGYHDGIKQGEKNVRRFIADLFTKHLDYSPKPKNGKWPTENQLKAMQKFKEFMEEEN